MATNHCPVCNADIALEDINVPQGVGLCRACGKLSRLDDIAEAGESDAAVTAQAIPPKGCRVDDDGARIVVRASCRSLASAGGLAFFCLFWNGIVSVFVLVAAAGLYTNLVGPLPQWFPAPTNGKSGGNMPLGMCLFLCVFLTPFVIIGVSVFAAFLTSLMGETSVTIQGTSGIARTGIGPLAWSKRFDAASVKRISIDQTAWKQNNQSRPVIRIEADRPIKFGSTLTDERRAWMLGTLRTLLLQPAPRHR